tara:strand:+ start:3154 stop:3918 length:765 start_codon:yes stop_codon:yes gene_type:complete
MTNPYKKHLDNFFETVTDFKHTSNRLNKVLLKDVEKYTAEGARYFSGTSLVIGDWSGPTDNGWKLNFHTGIQKSTFKENYSNEIEKVLSREFGLAYSQCYEAFETLLKDFISAKILSDQNFREGLPAAKDYSRENLRGGDDIFNLVKKAGGKRFKNYSNQNNNNFRFGETFKVFSEIRHAITHSQGVLNSSKIPQDKYYQGLFEHLLPLNKLDDDSILLKFDYKTLDRLIIYLSEFGYQVFKILSEEDKYEWKI